MFYNTTGEKGELLAHYLKTAKGQDKTILTLFLKNAELKLTPFEVQAKLALRSYNYPITSIRRSINTLTREGFLTMLDEKRVGRYGRPNHLWKVADSYQSNAIDFSHE